MNETIGPEFAGPNPEALDARWYRSFELISSQNDDIDVLKGDSDYREQQKIDFISGTIENPTLDTTIDLESIEKEEAELLELKTKIIQEEKNEVIVQTYRWRINEEIAKIRMLRESKQGNMRRFKRYAEFVYGKPSTEYYSYSVYEIKKLYAKMSDSDEPSVKEAIEFLNENLLMPEEETEFPGRPSEETMKAVHEIIMKEYGELKLPEFSAEETFNDVTTVKIFEAALKAIGASDWEVIISPNQSVISVSQREKTVKIPTGREMELGQLQKLIMHEVKRHAGRRISGEKSSLSLLGLGLDRYVKGEEGVAKLTEHGVVGKFKSYDTPELYLAVALGVGTDGKPRDFRETYEILKRILFLKAIRSKKSPDDAEKESQEKAWRHCVRVFRGSDCKTPGACFTKDTVYREGSIAVWDVVMKDIDEIYKFSIGKYDPSNPRHLWILSQLGITDERLQELES